MRVQDILRTKGDNLITISTTASIREAVRTISDEQVGMLLVVNDQTRLVGLLSERDIVGFLARRGSLDSPVSAAMSTDWLTTAPQESITNLVRTMTEKRARHIPVLSDGELVGVISIGDILKSRLVEKNQEAEVLREIALSSMIAAA